jgi:hypothetical protein
MTRPSPDALLTLDEAVDLVDRSALALVDAIVQATTSRQAS